MFDQVVLHIIDGVYITGVQAGYLPGIVDYLRGKCIKHVVNLYHNAVENDEVYWEEGLPLSEAVMPHVVWPDDFTPYECAISPLATVTHEQLADCVDYVSNTVRSGHHVLLVSYRWDDVAAIFVLGYWLNRGYDLRDAIRKMRGAPRMSRKEWEMLLGAYPTPYTFEDIKMWIQSW